MELEPVIGLEVHVQLATKSKLFCRCPNKFGEEPNTNICPVCTAMPGALPVLNAAALDLGLKVALGLGCTISRAQVFERKNYFYPDLPKAYQVSQLASPMGVTGLVDIGYKKVRINRAHMEEDAGKLVHAENASLADFNRCGVPLVEIVTEPDLFSADEAYDFLTELKRLVQYVGASSCDMEKGFLRCDANVSVKEKGATQLGTKTEIKNLNSFKAVREAIEFEIKRQRKAVLDGGKITQETRLWDDEARKTVLMRSKEEAHDYRYFPEPDLVTYTMSEERISKARTELGELPREKGVRLREQLGLSEYDVDVIISAKAVADYFESSVAAYANPKKIANWLTGPLFEIVNGEGRSFDDGLKMLPAEFAALVKAVEEGTINNHGGKEVLRELMANGGKTADIITSKGLAQSNSADDLIPLVDRVIGEQPKAVAEFKEGKERSLMFLVGQVMKESKGRANPKVLQDLFIKRING
jgi:aspartyl-tRNA(Asn)/glutamyl-tRNA(Gln) amidotransferase subunit B